MLSRPLRHGYSIWWADSGLLTTKAKPPHHLRIEAIISLPCPFPTNPQKNSQKPPHKNYE